MKEKYELYFDNIFIGTIYAEEIEQLSMEKDHVIFRNTKSEYHASIFLDDSMKVKVRSTGEFLKRTSEEESSTEEPSEESKENVTVPQSESSEC